MPAAKPRLLLVPEFTELEWAIKPLLEEWAEVISYDVPGVGQEPLPEGADDISALTREMAVERGLEKIAAAGWERFFVVADSWGIATAVRIAAKREERVAGVALGHAKLSFARGGDRPPLNAEVYEVFTQMTRQDAPAFLQHAAAQVTKGATDEERARQIMERVPRDFVAEGWRLITADEPFGDEFRRLRCPVLLVKHEGCLMSTDEGFEDVTEALPDAETAAVEEQPSASEQFAHLLRGFCLRHANG